MEETRTPVSSRLSVPTVQSLGFAQSFGIKSVCNVSLSSLIINSFTKEKDDLEKDEDIERKNSLVHKTSFKNKMWLNSSRSGGQISPDTEFTSAQPLLCQVKQNY